LINLVKGTGNNKSINTALSWDTYIDYSGSDVKLESQYLSGLHSVLLRNRDLDGDGIIDPEELRWYIASLDQLCGLFIGDQGLSSEAQLYPIEASREPNTPVSEGVFNGVFPWRLHVVSSTAFALKCVEAGCDAVVAEGFEAGGHNGREETTTLTLIPNVVAHCNLPIIAAGGIASGKSMLAAMALGAEGVQIGSRFAAAEESSAHQLFKTRIWDTQEGGTMLALKKLAPTRLIKNEFYQQVKQLEDDGADAETMKQLLGKGRAKQGMFEGDLDNGELEIGQVASMLTHPETVEAIFNDILQDYRESLLRMNHQTL
jgi:hypothetical protein